jgi:hypothetical protein
VAISPRCTTYAVVPTTVIIFAELPAPYMSGSVRRASSRVIPGRDSPPGSSCFASPPARSASAAALSSSSVTPASTQKPVPRLVPGVPHTISAGCFALRRLAAARNASA